MIIDEHSTTFPLINSERTMPVKKNSHCILRLATALTALIASEAPIAASFDLLNGNVSGEFDSILTYGIAWRVGGADPGLDTPTNGGNANFAAGDLVANRLTGTHELGLHSGGYGAFFRATYFYDGANDRKNLAVPGFSDGSTADERAVNDISLLDAYFYGNLGKLNYRIGKQVISWGENTFIQGSLNDINTLDVSKLRAPGAELKEALLPNEAIYSSFQVNDSVSLEGFYLLDFDETLLDPAGTFWNTATFVADGGYRLGPLLRASNHYAKNSGQWGIASRLFLPDFLTGFEFGFYYMTLHSHSPYISSIAGVPYGVSAPVPTARYLLEYPEDTQYVGASFNTNVNGWAWSGEISHRKDAPVQLDGFVDAALGAPVPLTNGTRVAPGTYIRGWDRVKVNQFQTTVQRIFIPRALHADSGVFLAEMAVNWVTDRPTLPTNEPITSSSGGYVLRYAMDYNRAIANVVNLSPTLAFRHDVWGVSSETGGGKLFIKDRKSVSIGLNWSYLTDFTGSISYTANFDGGEKKGASGSQLYSDQDRRWLSVNFGYQF